MPRTKASGLGGALKKHAKDETIYRQEIVNLPPGINGGIAEIVDAKLGTFQKGANQGELFIYLAGVVLEPGNVTYAPRIWKDSKIETLEPKTVDVKGQRTSQLLALCETKTRDGKVTTQDENISIALNHLRMLGGEDFTEDVETQEDLEGLLKTLIIAAPRFKFSTNAGVPEPKHPEPRTWENWHGSKGLEDYEPVETEGIIDSTGDEADEIPFEDSSKEKEPVDLVALGVAADAGDEEAEEKLMELAEVAGITKLNTFDDMSWEEVGERLSSGDTSESEEESWEVGHVCKYRAPKKDEEGRWERVAAFEILEINEGNGTCTLQHCATEEVYEDVLIGNLIPPE